MLIRFMADFFNTILNSGYVPEIWSLGLIVPMYKNKGDRSDPNNYRGITLLSCLGKLFTSCLNFRINEYLKENDILGYEQAGFREEHSTIDHVFTLHAIIEYYKVKNKQLYCAFVDYKKAFDTIDRSALWLKLMNEGIEGKIFTVIHNMYQEAKSCVKCNNDISPFFSCNIGVRQGENLSPILFAIFLNDFQEFLSHSSLGLVEISSDMSHKLSPKYIVSESDITVFIKLYTLLYADDTILLAESSDQLQKCLNSLDKYCQKWHLSVNVNKTKIVIFSRGYIKKHPKFYIGNSEIEVCREYIYLGVTFSANGSFNPAIRKQISQARKAQFALLEKVRTLRLPPDIVIELYNQCITPILLYGCEVWGFTNIEPIEIFHRSFLRQLLKTFGFTANCMLYGESGMTDMRTRINIRLVNYWAKLKTGDPRKLSSSMCHLISRLHDQDHFPNFKPVSIVISDVQGNDTFLIDGSDHSFKYDFNFKWIKHVKDTINKINLFNFWTLDCFELTEFKNLFKRKCMFDFRLRWETEMKNNSQCSFYRLIKNTPFQENYLKTQHYGIISTLSKFRTGSHHLPYTRKRFDKSGSHHSLECELCAQNVVGDEIHYLFHCNFFDAKRACLVPELVTCCNNVEQLSNIFNSDDANRLSNFSRFVQLIINQFAYKNTKKGSRQLLESPAYSTIVPTTRSGRICRPPTRLDL